MMGLGKQIDAWVCRIGVHRPQEVHCNQTAGKLRTVQTDI